MAAGIASGQAASGDNHRGHGSRLTLYSAFFDYNGLINLTTEQSVPMARSDPSTAFERDIVHDDIIAALKKRMASEKKSNVEYHFSLAELEFMLVTAMDQIEPEQDEIIETPFSLENLHELKTALDHNRNHQPDRNCAISMLCSAVNDVGITLFRQKPGVPTEPTVSTTTHSPRPPRNRPKPPPLLSEKERPAHFLTSMGLAEFLGVRLGDPYFMKLCEAMHKRARDVAVQNPEAMNADGSRTFMHNTGTLTMGQFSASGDFSREYGYSHDSVTLTTLRNNFDALRAQGIAVKPPLPKSRRVDVGFANALLEPQTGPRLR
ncbi:MAG: hypothetical protein ACKVOE_02520 [Rickettsiales bacterium]